MKPKSSANEQRTFWPQLSDSWVSSSSSWSGLRSALPSLVLFPPLLRLGWHLWRYWVLTPLAARYSPRRTQYLVLSQRHRYRRPLSLSSVIIIYCNYFVLFFKIVLMSRRLRYLLLVVCCLFL